MPTFLIGSVRDTRWFSCKHAETLVWQEPPDFPKNPAEALLGGAWQQSGGATNGEREQSLLIEEVGRQIEAFLNRPRSSNVTIRMRCGLRDRLYCRLQTLFRNTNLIRRIHSYSHSNGVPDTPHNLYYVMLLCRRIKGAIVASARMLASAVPRFGFAG